MNSKEMTETKRKTTTKRVFRIIDEEGNEVITFKSMREVNGWKQRSGRPAVLFVRETKEAFLGERVIKMVTTLIQTN